MQRNAKKCWEMQRNVVRQTGIILAKIRALDGQNYGRNSNFIFNFNFLKKSKLAKSWWAPTILWNKWFFFLGRIITVHFVQFTGLAHGLTVPNSTITSWMCTKSQIDGQNHKNTGVRRAIFPQMHVWTGAPVFRRATWVHWWPDQSYLSLLPTKF